jgi:hypothetical protein
MQLHKFRITAAALGVVTAAVLCAAPVVASAEGITPHYGFQLRDYQLNNNNQNSDPPTVPEPGTLALSLGGLAGLLAMQVRRRRSK